MPQDCSIKKVFDDRQISKSLLGWDVGNIRAPFLIGPIAPEVLAHQIRVGMNSSIAIVDEPVGIPFSGNRANIELSHQSQYRFVVDFDPIFSLNPDLDSPVAIGLPRFLICLKNQLHSLYCLDLADPSSSPRHNRQSWIHQIQYRSFLLDIFVDIYIWLYIEPLW